MMRLSLPASLICISLLVLGACGGGGGGNGGNPQPTATPAPTPEPAAGLEAAAGVATSTIVATTTILSGVPGADPRGAIGTGGGNENGEVRFSTLVNAVGSFVNAGGGPPISAGGAAGTTAGCPAGGTLQGSCSESGGSSTVSATLFDCRIPDPDSDGFITARGGLTVTIAAAGVCRTGVIPDTARTTTRLDNFSVTVSDRSGNELAHYTAPRFTQTEEPAGQGCAGRNGSGTSDGTFRATSTPAGIDLTITARNLRLQRVSAGAPCVEQVTAEGGLDLQDHAAGLRFGQSLHALALSLQEEAGGGLLATLDGAVNNNCLGELTFETLAPILLPGGGGCPNAGHLRVARGDGAAGEVRFTASGGLDLRYEGDGGSDRAVSSCNDPSLRQCR